MSDTGDADHDVGGGGGLIGFFARNHVAGNLLMLLFLAGGLYTVVDVDVRNLPALEPRTISITVPYPGATAAEVEEEITRRVEENVLVLDGVAGVTSMATESLGTVTVDLQVFASAASVLDDVRTAVERIERFPPSDADQPEIELTKPTRTNVTVAVASSTLSEDELRRSAEQVLEDLLALPEVSLVVPFAVPAREISIEVSEEALREHGLTISTVAREVRQSSLNISSGEIRTDAGGLMLRTHAKRLRGEDFLDIVVLSRDDGTIVQLGDVATVRDTFEDVDVVTRVDGRPAVLLNVNRDVDQEPREIAGAVKRMIAGYDAPAGADVLVWDDRTRTLGARLGWLVSGGLLGFALVFVLLSLVFDFRIAVWVAVGVPTSFLGACLFFPAFDMSINIMTIFGLILVIGIVVDDAVVVGESIASEHENGVGGVRAAIAGARSVLAPVVVGVLTTMVAFAPLLFTYGGVGQLMNILPVVVFLVLSVSLIEAFLILPSHLAGGGRWSHWPLAAIQARSRAWLANFRDARMVPAISWAVRRPYATIAISTAFVVGALLLFAGGAVRFVFFESLPSDRVEADVTFPTGTPFEATLAAAEQIAQAGRAASDLAGDPVRSVSVIAGHHLRVNSLGGDAAGRYGSHLATVALHLRDESERSLSPKAFERLWRRLAGDIPGAESVRFISTEGSISLPGVSYALVHPDDDSLARATAELRGALDDMPAVFQLEDSLVVGKPQYDIELSELGKTAGLTPGGLAAQLRARFFGDEVQRLQRGRDEIKVMVRYPEERRHRVSELMNERISRTAARGGGVAPGDNAQVPLYLVADISETRGYRTLTRMDGIRAAEVKARIDTDISTPRRVAAELSEAVLPMLLDRYPGLRVEPLGQAKEQADVQEVLAYTIPLALLVMYILIAVQFRSYAQPFIVLAAMPFGMAGAIIGHWVLGYDVSIVSVFGVLAVAGVVMNDTLVLMDRYNKIRASSEMPAIAAVSAAARQRFRPIVLTTATTVVGVLPILLFKAEVTQNLVPMIVSLVFGMITATFGILLFTPAVLLVAEGLRERFAAGR